MCKCCLQSLLLGLIALAPRLTFADDAPPPVPPKVAVCTPLAVPVGATTKVILRGWTIDKATAVKCDNDKVALKVVTAGTAPVPGKQDAKVIGDQQLELEVTTPSDFSPGPVELTVVAPSGESMSHTLLVGGDQPLVAETEPNDGFRQAQPISTSQIVDGQIHADGNVDVFSFELTESTKLQIEVQAAQLGSCLDSLLTLYNAAGSVISSHDDQADTTDSELDVTLGPGRYFVCLQDAHDRGGPAHPYRLIVKHSPAP